MPEAGRPYDLAVIGAGINGAGIARDAALRGLRVIVLEQNDLCSGTSAWSSRLIHGGLRYLEYGELPLVFESLRERIGLRRIAGHLVKPLKIRIPVYESARRGPLLIRLGLALYDLLSLGRTVPGHEMLGRERAMQEEPGLAADGLRAVASYYDAQVTFAERLVLENLLAARAAGAEICTYNEVTNIDVTGGIVRGLDVTDRLTGDVRHVPAKVIVNAAGPWVDSVLDTTAVALPDYIGGTKGSHIVVAPFDGAPADAYYVEAESDGRPFFIIPWNGQYLIGTTDIRYEGELETLRASAEEVRYLLAETNRIFPRADLDTGDIHYAYAGVRPLPRKEGGPASAITRKHIIRRHNDVARGLVSIIGGKLTTYRNLAEQTVDRVGRLLGRKLPDCRTADVLLPGADAIEPARAALDRLETLSADGVERLLGIYGSRARNVAELAGTDPRLGATLDPAGRVLAAEVIYAARDEMARTLVDIVHRRLMIGFDPDQGRPLYESIADLAAVEFGLDAAARQQALDELVAYSDSLRGEY